jgi:HEAT repeat protein
MGLVQTAYTEAGVELVRLLADREHDARIGAVRALAFWGGTEAELLLRYKAMIGDQEAEVVAECFSALLSLAPERSLDFVAGYLDDAGEAIAEGAALALGESRQERAFDILRAKVQTPIRRAVLLGIALLRRDAAIEYLLSVIAGGDELTAKEALDAMEMYRQDPAMAERIQRATAGGAGPLTRAEPPGSASGAPTDRNAQRRPRPKPTVSGRNT